MLPAACSHPLQTVMMLAVDRLVRHRPVLVLIDDANRDDAESLSLLGSAFRNASTEQIAMLVAARTPPPGTGPETMRYELGPLTDRDAAALLDALPGVGRDRPRAEILRRAAGNPLALITFSRSPNGLLPAEFLEALDTLDADTRTILRHAALAGRDEDVATVGVAAGCGTDLRAWQPAEKAGLITVVDSRVRFRHPLIQAACAFDGDVGAAHRSLARHTGDPQRRARHLGAAADCRDEAIAAALENTADHARRNSDYLDEARSLQTAAERSPHDADAARRYALAVFAAYRAAEPGWAIDLHHHAVSRSADADITGASACGAGLALIHMGQPDQAFELTQEAILRGPHDSQVSMTAVAVAATAVLMSGDPEHRATLPGLLDLIGTGEPGGLGEGMVPPSVNAVARAAVLATASPTGDTPASADDCEATATGLAEMARMLFDGTVAWLADDSARAAAELHAVWRAQTLAGAPGSAVARLPLLVTALIDTGKWAEADEVLDAAADLAAVGDIQLLREVVPPLRATVRALRQDGPVPSVPDPAGPIGRAFSESLAARAAGLTALAADDHVTAYGHFRALFDDDGEPRHYFLGPRSLPQLAYAAAQLGTTAEARRIIARHRGEARTGRVAMLLAHAEALVDDDQAEECFRGAVGDPVRALRWPFEFAEAQLNYGLWLRRRRRLRDAQPHLLDAWETFRHLGADGHARQAGQALPPDTGDRDVSVSAFADLSQQKQLIAQLAAEGKSNREIADRLFLSPRTVGSHLYRIYPQLGVSSRHQLREVLSGPHRTGVGR